MDWGMVAAFWLVSIALVCTPGVDWAYAITAGIRRNHVVAAVGGMLSAHLFATLCVAAGIASLFATRGYLMDGLTVLGAMYLVWLGVSVMRNPPTPDIDSSDGAITARSAFRRGVGVTLLNPKLFLFFLALFPQFASASASLPVGAQMLVLGLVHLVGCAFVYLAVAYGVGRVVAARPNLARIIGRLSGAAMIILGGILLVEKVIELS